jgi:apolipoprotein D and lipocalin family protein
MKFITSAALGAAAFVLAACNPALNQPVGNPNVPEPAKAVELERYLGRWHELARYEASFQKDCEAVTADYSLRPDGDVRVVNTCRKGSPDGPAESAEAVAKLVEGSNGAKLKVSFFGPFYGDYWVLDRAPDYSWAIVGEPEGKFLWILSRKPNVTARQYDQLVQRAAQLGYDTSLLRRTQF